MKGVVKICIAGVQAFSWVLITLVTGLAPYIAVMLLSTYRFSSSHEMIMEKYLKTVVSDGPLAFLGCACMIGFCLDEVFIRKEFSIRTWKDFVQFGCPVILLVLMMAQFPFTRFGMVSDFVVLEWKNLTFFVAVFSLLYALSYKFFKFLKQNQ